MRRGGGVALLRALLWVLLGVVLRVAHRKLQRWVSRRGVGCTAVVGGPRHSG